VFVSSFNCEEKGKLLSLEEVYFGEFLAGL